MNNLLFRYSEEFIQSNVLPTYKKCLERQIIVERELNEYKIEIEKKFAKSKMNKTYKFPRVRINLSVIVYTI